MAAIPSFLAPTLRWKIETSPEVLSTGIGPVDALIEGCPRGRITEIAGPQSSGRSTLLYAILAEAARLGEFCALVDGASAFDPHAAAAAGVNLERLVWIRCGGNPEHAMRAADLLLHSGGFGVIALDLCEIAPRSLRRIPLSSWYRFRRVLEPTTCALVLLNTEPQAKACATVLLEMQRKRAAFTGGHPLLDSAWFHASVRKPVQRGETQFEIKAV